MGKKEIHFGVSSHRFLVKGIALVWMAITSTVMIGFAALAIDIGHMLIVRTEYLK